MGLKGANDCLPCIFKGPHAFAQCAVLCFSSSVCCPLLGPVAAMAAVVLVVHVLGGRREEESDDERDQRARARCWKGELMSKGVPLARMQNESPHHLLCNGEGEGAVRVPRTPVFIKGEGLSVESVSRCRLSIVVQAAA
jgi:hypothetical protein